MSATTRHRCLAVIPARGGSKGIAKKNLALVAGKPLLRWTIEASLDCEEISSTLVSSDDSDILQEAVACGARALPRPAELATDSIGSEPLLVHAIQRLQQEGSVFDEVILLQPTSPLRTSQDISEALAQFRNADAASLISVYEPNHHPLKSFLVDAKGALQGVLNNDYPFLPRQSLPQAAVPNGAIYIVKTAVFLERNRFFIPPVIAFFMPPERSVDIDSMEDIRVAEAFLSRSTHPK